MAEMYTLEQVSTHSTPQDCWIIIQNKVYNVTSYLEEHPGGDEVILSATGKDATDDFDDAGHSKEARQLLTKYYIGDVDLSMVSKSVSSKSSKWLAYIPDNVFIIRVLQLAVPVGILGLAIAVRHYRKASS